MKIFWRFVFLIIFIVFISYMLMLPNHNISFKIYSGQQNNTITKITVIPINMSINIKRLPFDVLWMSPIKLIPYLDVSFISEMKLPEERPYISYMQPVYENTLGYCYLLALQQTDNRLPSSDNLKKDSVYNISDYTNNENFILSELKLDLMPEDIMNSFFTIMANIARSKMISTDKPIKNSIAEFNTSDGKKYLFIYTVSKDKTYVVDPEYPQNLQSCIIDNKYSVYTDTYEIINYYRIMGDIK